MCNVKSKKCSKCGENKPLSEFYKDRTKKDGLRSHCKSCRKEKSRNYRQENREALNERYRKYYQKNKEAEKERRRNYRQENKEAENEYHKKYYKKRYDNDPEYRTKYLLRAQTQRLGDFKNTNTIELIGCPANEFWIMNGSPTIEELQDLHIDHIIPLSWFDLSNEAHVKVCNHYLNLQYLNSEDNISKGDRYAGSPNNMLGYKDEFDVDAYVSDTLARIEELNLHNHKNYNICQF